LTDKVVALPDNPANGFYEWKRATGPGPRRAGEPFYICDRSGGLLALAGVFEVWYDAEDVALRSCAVITTGAAGVAAEIHDRMPVLVAEEDWAAWLAPDALAPDEAAALLRPEPDRLVVRAVSERVNKAANEGPDLIEAVSPS
jgi:putative SOS response-associated peptidase YedK